MRQSLIFFTLILFVRCVYGQWTVNATPFNSFSDLNFNKDNWGAICGGNTIAMTFDQGLNWIVKNFDELEMVTNVDIISDSVAYVTSSFEFGFYKTVDRGTTWQYFGPPVYYFSIADIFAINRDTMYGISPVGYFYKTYNGFLITYLDGITGGALRSLFFTDIDTGYVAAESDLLKKTSDAAESWGESVSSPIASAIQFPSSRIGYVIGDGNLYKTIDYSNTWTELPSAADAGYYFINDLFFINELEGFVTAYDEVNDKGLILKTYDGGLTWVFNDIPENIYQVNQIYCLNGDTCFAIAQIHEEPFTYLIKTTNGGGVDTSILNINLTNGLQFEITPNPATDFILLNISKNIQIQNIYSYNLYGQAIKVEFDESGYADIANLNSGVYFTLITTSNGTQVKKWIKNKLGI